MSTETDPKRRATDSPKYRVYQPQDIPVLVADGLWTVEGATVLFGHRLLQVPCPTRMTVIALEDGGLALHSPVAFNERLLSELQSIGPIRCLIAPNSYHFLHVGCWAEKLPRVEVFVHRRSRTVIFTDLVQNFELARVDGRLAKLAIWLAGATGMPPRTSIELRMLARRNGMLDRVAQSFQTIRGWNPDRVLIAHGAQPEGHASTLLENAFRWAE